MACNNKKDFSKFALASPLFSNNEGSGLGFGCMGMTSFYGDAMSDEDAMELLKAVYDGGCRHFDTAEAYGNADPNKHNEVVLGKFLKTVPRESYSVATKFWPSAQGGDDDGGDDNYDTIKAHLVASLQRLGLDYVDLYYAHRVVTLQKGIQFAQAAKRLQEEGLIKEVGLSEVSGAWLKQIYDHCPIAAVQQEWSLLTRSLETELVPVCKELGVTIVAYSPLARNLLVQKMDAPPQDWRASNPRYAAENLAQNNQHFDQVQRIASKLQCTPAQLCLAWLLAQAQKLGVAVVPIAGTTKKERATSNLGAIKVEIKDDDDWKVLNAMADQVVGARYSEQLNHLTIEAQQEKTAGAAAASN